VAGSTFRNGRKDARGDSVSVSFRNLQQGLISLPLVVKQLAAVLFDSCAVLFTLWLAFSFRYEVWHIPAGSQWAAYILALLFSLPVFFRAGMYRSVFRYSEVNAIKLIIRAITVYGVLFFTALVLLKIRGVPRSVGLFQPMMLFLVLLGSRELVRVMLSRPALQGYPGDAWRKLLIYGVGSAGVQLAAAIEASTNYELAGFIDDDPKLQGRTVKGLKVLSFDQVPEAIEKRGVSDILLAIPSVGRSRRSAILKALQPFPVHVRTLPSLDDMASGNVSINDIKEVDIEDLLGRDPVKPDPSLFSRNIAGRTVLVTGAGGSIGSELCRQVLAAGPRRLVLVDHSELNLHTVYTELRAGCDADIIVPVLCNVAEEGRIALVCEAQRPQTMFHAAAYKHVPMVEINPVEGVRNNVMGTFHAASAACDHGVENFILVSTDKAVRPTNVMGASKRFCEIILQAMAEEFGRETCFSMVRFGNVLGSSGSVVPLFRRQIHEGGPVTVTHPEITRYFMTIPEAVELVIQAGAMATGGDVFLLDMGEPVRIMELARKMIELSGLTVRDSLTGSGDIAIEITGLRPGEKLHEELLIGDNPLPTMHPRIFKAHEEFIPWADLKEKIAKLSAALEKNDVEVMMEELRDTVRGFRLRTADEKQDVL